MLDSVTKRKIDTCRDILVGKIPDPKSQVEQITIALIYKFMDDMDTSSVELGGERVFFAGEYEQYSWKNLMSPANSGHTVLDLYMKAIQEMDRNPNIPQLFRDIFRNAYLPYRDPETLRDFLSTINWFEYDHSERLGDAFEYLLSVLGSQGDAGQFRTPRHIIDFMVEITAPRKDEKILDPACGTAGFLISSYKYIFKHNSSDYKEGEASEAFEVKDTAIDEVITGSNNYKGDKLSHDDKLKLSENIAGYDISPDMVRLSRANMYLHGLNSPKIFEYNTLEQDDKWNEYADVIMANPPFMSPRGGIKTNNRFSIQSKRSEVLFVDYIMEHLTANGRAAVIVPEGIIFQSGTAYKQLRKMLVEGYLFGVVSLPGGVFNPYSGVKTSILLMDKGLCKKTDKILFMKIENDGFDLGAQRRPNNKSDLPGALRSIKGFVSAVDAGKEFETDGLANVNVVEKEKIGENGEWNLSGERYVEEKRVNKKYEIVELGREDIFKIEAGGTPSSQVEEYWNGDIVWLTLVDLPQGDFISQIKSSARKITKAGLENSSAKLIPPESIIVSTRATIGRVGINHIELATNQGFKNVIIKDKEKASPLFVAYMIKNLEARMNELATGGTFKELSKSKFSELTIPLPPLEVQREIVGEIEGYQKIIDGARQVVENYKPHIDIDPDWEMVELGEVCEINPKKSEISDLDQNMEVSFVPMADINENQMHFSTEQIKMLEEVYKGYTYFKDGDVLLAKVTPCFENGKAGIAMNLKNNIGFGSSELFVLRPSSSIRAQWIYCNIVTDHFRREGQLKMTGTGGLQRVPKFFVESYNIPLPSLEIQDQIIAEINNDLKIIELNKGLIKKFVQKIENRIGKVWGEKE